MKTYRKIATIQAKLFEFGDEDGFVTSNPLDDNAKLIPYIVALENNCHKGEFGNHYLCIGIDGEKWLVEKSIFERTYQEI